MKTIKRQIEELLAEDNYSCHPSREEEIKIKRLERIVVILAQQIDNLINHVA